MGSGPDGSGSVGYGPATGSTAAPAFAYGYAPALAYGYAYMPCCR